MITIEKTRGTHFLIRAINHPIRLAIYNLLLEEEMTVLELQIRLRRVQGSVSQHLAIMRKANLVDYREEGLYNFYSINRDTSDIIINILKQNS